jgi:hypothetical protein
MAIRRQSNLSLAGEEPVKIFFGPKEKLKKRQAARSALEAAKRSRRIPMKMKKKPSR